jgi:hypothetical protein
MTHPAFWATFFLGSSILAMMQPPSREKDPTRPELWAMKSAFAVDVSLDLLQR